MADKKEKLHRVQVSYTDPNHDDVRERSKVFTSKPRVLSSSEDRAIEHIKKMYGEKRGYNVKDVSIYREDQQGRYEGDTGDMNSGKTAGDIYTHSRKR